VSVEEESKPEGAEFRVPATGVEQPRILPEKYERSQAGGAESGAALVGDVALPDGLAELTQAWKALSPEVVAVILSLVRASVAAKR
jgi:hypothetical protein